MVYDKELTCRSEIKRDSAIIQYYIVRRQIKFVIIPKRGTAVPNPSPRAIPTFHFLPRRSIRIKNRLRVCKFVLLSGGIKARELIDFGAANYTSNTFWAKSKRTSETATPDRWRRGKSGTGQRQSCEWQSAWVVFACRPRIWQATLVTEERGSVLKSCILT